MKFIALLFFLSPVFHSINVLPAGKYFGQSSVQRAKQDNVRLKAFNILRNKCNTCHAAKKRTDVFTLENMVGYAPEIYNQVFVKKKMPKGRKLQLTENEAQNLRHWIETVLKVK